MDHLWLDRNVQRKPDSIPYYDPGDYKYTQRGVENWLSTVAKKLVASLSTAEGVIIVQELMFFGVLTEYCALLGLDFCRERFVTQGIEQPVLSTSELHLLAEDAIKLRAQSFHSGNHAPSQYIRSHFCNIFKNFTTLMTDESEVALLRRRPAHDSERKLHASIRELLGNCGEILSGLLQTQHLHRIDAVALVAYCVLLESLVGLTTFVFNHLDVPILRTGIVANNTLDTLWITRCRESRICPERLEDLLTNDPSISQAYIASSIVSLATSNHRNCIIGPRCRDSLININLPLHRPKCDRSCKDCFLSPKKLSDLETRIRDNGYGLLEWVHDALDDPAFRIRTSSASTEYIAFSHVWYVHIE